MVQTYSFWYSGKSISAILFSSMGDPRGFGIGRFRTAPPRELLSVQGSKMGRDSSLNEEEEGGGERERGEIFGPAHLK